MPQNEEKPKRNSIDDHLIQCVHRDDSAGIRQCLKKGANPNKALEDGWTSFLIACFYGHLRSVQTLIQHTVIYFGQTLACGANGLFLACQGEHGECLELVRYLLHHTDISIDQPKHTGASPIYIAAERGHASVVRLLLQQQQQQQRNNIQVDRAVKNCGGTPLYVACSNGWTRIVRLLVELGKADVNKAEMNGATPLCVACYYGHSAIVIFLVTNTNARVNQAMTSSGSTPLHSAAKRGKLAIVKCLVEQGHANVNQQDIDGETALHAACQAGFPLNHLAVVQYLCEKAGADIHATTKEGLTPFMMSCQRSNKYIEVAQYLWAAAARTTTAGNFVDVVNQTDRLGRTPLMLACWSGSVKIARWLLHERSACILKRDNRGKTTHDLIQCSRPMKRIFKQRARYIQRRWNLVQFAVANELLGRPQIID